MQTVKSNLDGSPTAPAYPASPEDIGYFLLVDRSSGRLIVQLAGGGVSFSPPDAEGDPVTSNPMVVGGVDGNGDVRTLRTNTSGILRVSLEDAIISAGNLLVELDAASDSVTVLQSDPDDLACNANLQVGDVDVSDSNPVPVVMPSLSNLTLLSPSQTIKNVASTLVPEALGGNTRFVRLSLLGYKDEARTMNVGDVYVGATNVDGKQPYPIKPGGEILIEAPPGYCYQLSDWYLDVETNGDGVVMIIS